VPKPLAQVLGHVPPRAALAQMSVRGRAANALRFSSLIALQQSATRALFAEVDRIIAFREWVRALLVANGVNGDKIAASTHALCHPVLARRRTATRPQRLRVAFLGRLDPTKGVDVLIRAMRDTRGADIVLDIYGAAQGDSGRREREQLQQLAAGDSRVSLKFPLDPSAVVETLATYDVLAVPSQWMETGPLVVLEAFAAGVPVIGSGLGGIAELVSDGVNGLLIRDHRSPNAWAAALMRLANHHDLVDALGSRVTAPKDMGEVATEMISLYEALAGGGVGRTRTVTSVA
jgi:glycosyltransferase involved in cell wall biosynthesis